MFAVTLNFLQKLNWEQLRLHLQCAIVRWYTSVTVSGFLTFRRQVV